ncbi:MAG: carboxy terminal-processing peptidase [Saprospiraceae bacterium]|nr:carboxy terminal-processing peptidase [Saprospiraceae bacterium]
MMFRSSVLAAVLFAFLMSSMFNNDPINKEKEKVILEGLMKFLDIVHFDPQVINDEFSQKVFDDYIHDLDIGKRFITQAEIDQLEPYRLLIDDQVRIKDLEFFDKSAEMMDMVVDRAEIIFNEVIEMDFDYSKDEKIIIDTDEKPHATNDAELKDYWRKSIKYDILSRFQRKMNDQEKLEDESKAKTESELMAEAKKQSKKSFSDWFKRLNKQRRSDRYETFLNSIANYFDPHTDYFSPKDKQDFDITMGGKLIGIGARLTEQDDYTKVASIVPGGPAYKGKELGVDDLITKVKQEDQEPVDVVGMRLDDVVQMIRGEEGTKVTLSIRKPDGSEKDITIKREEVIIDESFARSLILDLPGTIGNIGYIKLPKFYSSFEKEDGNSCAEDVAIELEKLKSKNVNGVILDLRNNSGGSLQDVVTMSGLFIEEGPIVQVKPKGRSPYVHKDNDSKVQYDGPLIVMVNNFSASASEILAAALQDYGRAIIVGSTSTFGKGTVQRFYDLDRAYSGNQFKPLGELKVTVQKFYRVDGGSTQLKGVESDIVLPDNFYYLDTGEKDYENAMAWSEIESVPFNQNVVELNRIADVKAKSQVRIENNEKFKTVLENAKRLKENSETKEISLNKDQYIAMMKERKKEAEKYDDIFDKEIEGFAVLNLDDDLPYIEMDESRKIRNEEWIKDVSKDFYLQETLSILRDMIELEESFATIEEKITKIKP